MTYLSLIGIPLLGVIWFLNFVSLISSINSGKNVRNQTIIGAALTFIVMFLFIYWFTGIH
ncbi:hypothetical protein [Neobacillus sp. PS2-9]|uniref:hypothetical protein n=1 Tax=Neobacillus sp. PS2-9 TaxID=3070676 RepID=UPI0027DEC283|nr:hypothetical protein [Neobacillus sp. PS2-9]WML56550.1 hypothetical protein RCG25_16620 [Neobacillus sp. PS2-9]